MVYECEQCKSPLPAGVTACPKCGEKFDETVPQDAEVPARGWQPKSETNFPASAHSQPELKIPNPPTIVNLQTHHPAPPTRPVSHTDLSLLYGQPTIAPSTSTAGKLSVWRIVLAIMFWPIAVLYLAYLAIIKIWKHPAWSSKTKSLLTALIAIAIITPPVLINVQEAREQALQQKAALAAQAQEAAAKRAEQKRIAALQATPAGRAQLASEYRKQRLAAEKAGEQAKQAKAEAAAAQTAATSSASEDEIKKMMQDRFGDNLQDVSVDQLDSGGYRVVVNFKAVDSLTTNLEKGSIEVAMERAYKDLYTSSFDIRKADMNAYGTVQDKFGAASTVPVYGTSMTAETGKKITWDNWPSLDFSQLWDVRFINHSFQ